MYNDICKCDSVDRTCIIHVRSILSMPPSHAVVAKKKTKTGYDSGAKRQREEKTGIRHIDYTQDRVYSILNPC